MSIFDAKNLSEMCEVFPLWWIFSHLDHDCMSLKLNTVHKLYFPSQSCRSSSALSKLNRPLVQNLVIETPSLFKDVVESFLKILVQVLHDMECYIQFISVLYLMSYI